MILRSDVATSCPQINAWLIHAAISKLHFVCLGTSRQRENLVTKANAENGSCRSVLHDGTHMFNCCVTFGGISRPIAQEQTIELIIREIIIPRNHSELHSQLIDEISDDIVFDSTVNSQNVHRWA
jgi:hypothetical protein